MTYDEADGSLIAANILKPGGKVDKTYTSYAARKVWYPKEKPKGEEEREAVFALQYLANDHDGAKVWKPLTTVTLNGDADDNLAVDDSAGGSADKMAYGRKRTVVCCMEQCSFEASGQLYSKGCKGYDLSGG